MAGVPLLRAALETRPWWTSGQVSDADFVFVLRDTEASKQFQAEALRRWYPQSKVVWLSAFTGGAALSASAGLSLLGHRNGPICVDLVDILYKSDFDPVAAFSTNQQLGGACLTFKSDKAIYSYIREENGAFAEAAEKRVISDKASAGTYFFRDSAIYMDALARSLAAPDAVTHNGLFFVCPLMNGVRAAGRAVTCHNVTDVEDIKV